MEKDAMDTTAPLTPSQLRMVDVWQEHCRAEFEAHSVDETMATMTPSPCLLNLPTLAGGVGAAGVREFYTRVFLPGIPPDTETHLVSRTVGADRIVDELIFRCTHTVRMDWMLPGLAPTGKRVVVALVAIVEFHGDKIASEHIFWDQGCVLAQLGLVDARSLPVVGAESERRLLDLVAPHQSSV
jgi:carboxymethylenebutenolidase